jgi:hypothetical protein
MSKLINKFVCRRQNKNFHTIKLQHGIYRDPNRGGPEAMTHTYWPMHNRAHVVFGTIIHDLYLAFKA